MGRSLCVGVALLSACAGTPRPASLREVESWAIQLQGLEKSSSLTRLERSSHDLLVVDRVHTVRGMERYDTAAVVERLRVGRLCLAYFNVGQAESYRSYWREDWREPTAEAPGSPSFLLTIDPDGWPGDFPVAYWDPSWHTLLLAQLDDVVARGYDGIYCDWVLGYEEPAVVAAAKRAGTDPAREMVALLRKLREYACKTNPGFLLVMQNGGGLFTLHPELAETVDGYAQEPLSFGGKAGVAWSDPRGADGALPEQGEWSTAAMLASLRLIRSLGVSTFTIDYCADPENARVARERARSVGAIPFVTRTILDRLP